MNLLYLIYTGYLFPLKIFAVAKRKRSASAREEAIIGGIIERDPVEDVAMRPPIGAKVAVPITRDRRPPILRLLLRQ